MPPRRRGAYPDLVRAVGLVLVAVLVGYLVVAAPLVGRQRYERFRQRLASDPGARLALYRKAPLRAAVMTALILLAGIALERAADDVDLRWPRVGVGLGMVAGFLVAFGFGTVLGLKQLHSERGRAFVEAQLGGARLLLPTTLTERHWSVAVAVAAGVSEELAYRGFLAETVRTWQPTWGWFAVAVVTSAVFGLAHLYQGVKGVVLTGVLGLALASLTNSTRSLVPAMVVHALIDIRSLTVIGWELHRVTSADAPVGDGHVAPA